MNTSKIIKELIYLPRKFHQIKTQSIVLLLKETGYSEIQNKVEIQEIRDALVSNPECISDWMQYSEDKRTSSGWYFKPKGTDKFVVGYLSEGRHSKKHLSEYDNDVDACAIFIKHEIDDITERHF